MDDAYTGLQRFNLFPIVGANGHARCTSTWDRRASYSSRRMSRSGDSHPWLEHLLLRLLMVQKEGRSFSTPGTGRLIPAIKVKAVWALCWRLHGVDLYNRAPQQDPLVTLCRLDRHTLRVVIVEALEGRSCPARFRSFRRLFAQLRLVLDHHCRFRVVALLGRAHDDFTSYVSPTDTPQITPRVPSPDALEYVVFGRICIEYDSASDVPPSPANPPTPTCSIFPCIPSEESGATSAGEQFVTKNRKKKKKKRATKVTRLLDLRGSPLVPVLEQRLAHLHRGTRLSIRTCMLRVCL